LVLLDLLVLLVLLVLLRRMFANYAASVAARGEDNVTIATQGLRRRPCPQNVLLALAITLALMCGGRSSYSFDKGLAPHGSSNRAVGTAQQHHPQAGGGLPPSCSSTSFWRGGTPPPATARAFGTGVLLRTGHSRPQHQHQHRQGGCPPPPSCSTGSAYLG
jgi:hypothetical protein